MRCQTSSSRSRPPTDERDFVDCKVGTQALVAGDVAPAAGAVVAVVDGDLDGDVDVWLDASERLAVAAPRTEAAG